MELTPSAASMSSSHKRNHSQFMAGDAAADNNGSHAKFTINRFNGSGNGAKLDSAQKNRQPLHEGANEGLAQGQNTNKTSNDSIMNPAI